MFGLWKRQSSAGNKAIYCFQNRISKEYTPEADFLAPDRFLKKEPLYAIMEEIRYAEKGDINFILQGIREICRIERQKPDSKAKLVNQIKKVIRKKEIRIIAQDKEAIGFIQFTFTKKSPYGIEYGNYERRFCWIDWMYVAKKFRNKGIGRALHKEVASACKKQGISEIMLDVFHINNSAMEFYKKEGFLEFIHILRERIN